MAECRWWAHCRPAPSYHHNGLQVVHLSVLSIGVCRCCSDYARLPFVDRLTVCKYIELLKSRLPYYEVANLVTVKKKNMIDKMPCAYRTLHVTTGRIYILLMYPMNPFRHMVTVGRNATVFIYNRIPTEPEEMAKRRSEGDMQRDASLRRWAQSRLPPGWL